MNIQPAPRTAHLEHLLEKIDNAVQQPQHLTPAPYGGPERDGLMSLTEAIAGNIGKRCRAAKAALDAIEQRALQSVAKARGMMEDHVAVCGRLDEEVTRVERVVAELSEQFREP